ncbi:MAG: paraquat-inducible protein A [Verrucomicrobiota bacterium]
MSSDLYSPSRTERAAGSLQCRLCGHEHREIPLQPGERALCARCGGVLAKASRVGGSGALALTLAGCVLAIPAVGMPFVTVDRLQNERVGYLLTGPEMLWSEGMRLLSIAVVLCGILAPLLLLAMLAVMLAPPRGYWPGTVRTALMRLAHTLEHWAMPEVYVLAVLVALTKLGTLVNVHVGPGFWCYAGMTIALLAAWRNFALAPDQPPPLRHARRHASRRSGALAFAAAVMLIPANLLPVLNTSTRGIERTDTILSGVLGLWKDGLYAISIIVFAASILIPLLKLVGLTWLLYAARHGTTRKVGLTRLYSTLEFIGRWSMLDVFLVAFLAGLVRFGGLATIEPRIGIVAFGAAVVLTVLATDAFDSRLLWQPRPGTGRAPSLSPAPALPSPS